MKYPAFISKLNRLFREPIVLFPSRSNDATTSNGSWLPRLLAAGLGGMLVLLLVRFTAVEMMPGKDTLLQELIFTTNQSNAATSMGNNRWNDFAHQQESDLAALIQDRSPGLSEYLTINRAMQPFRIILSLRCLPGRDDLVESFHQLIMSYTEGRYIRELSWHYLHLISLAKQNSNNEPGQVVNYKSPLAILQTEYAQLLTKSISLEGQLKLESISAEQQQTCKEQLLEIQKAMANNAERQLAIPMEIKTIREAQATQKLPEFDPHLEPPKVYYIHHCFSGGQFFIMYAALFGGGIGGWLISLTRPWKHISRITSNHNTNTVKEIP